MSLRSSVGRNALAGSASQALGILLSLLTTPVLLHSLGLTAYGAMAVIGSLTAYVGILDFGIGASLSRYMTIYHERNDQRALAGVSTFTLLFYGFMAAVLFPAVLAAAPAVGRFLSFPAELREQLPGLLMIVLGTFFGFNLLGLLGSRLASIQRMDVAAYAAMVGSLVSAGLTITLVPLYPSLHLVFALALVQLLIMTTIMYVALARLTKGPPLTFGRVSWPEIRDLFTFGFWTQISSVTAIVNLEADKAIISRYMGVADVAPYQVGNRIALLSRVFPLQLIGAMLPAVTARVGRGLSPSDLSDIYKRSSRALMMATLLIGGFVIAAADSILRFWLGTRLPWAAELCIALILSYAVNNATGVGTTIIKAQGKPQLETWYGILSAVVNIGMTLLLIRDYGLFGVVGGTIVGNLIGSVFFLVIFHKRTGISWWRSMGTWLVRLMTMTAVAGVAAFAILHRLNGDEMSRLGLLPGLIAAGLLYLSIFYGLGRLLRFWTDDDRGHVIDLLGKLRRKRRAAG